MASPCGAAQLELIVVVYNFPMSGIPPSAQQLAGAAPWLIPCGVLVLCAIQTDPSLPLMLQTITGALGVSINV